MAIYQIKFKPLSVATEFPSSQTIFGAFCNQYKKLYGEEKLEDFLQEQEENPTILFSNMYCNDLLPIPLDFSPTFSTEENLSEITMLRKKIKKIKYVSLNFYLNYKNNKEKIEQNFYNNINKEYKIINNEIISLVDENLSNTLLFKTDMRTRNSNSNDEENNLFSDKVMYYNNIILSIYVEVDDNHKNLLEVFESMKYVNFGGMKSIGYNLYQFLSFNSTNLGKDKYGLLISKCLINNINIDNSKYTFNAISNIYTGYSDIKYLNKLYILNEGSIIETDKKIIGNIVINEINHKKNYQFYYGLLI